LSNKRQLSARLFFEFSNDLMPNKLRIDAAEGGEAKRKGDCAAAFVRVERSRLTLSSTAHVQIISLPLTKGNKKPILHSQNPITPVLFLDESTSPD